MLILSVNISHDASITVMENGNLIYYRVEERLSRQKRSSLRSTRNILADAAECFKNVCFDLIIMTLVDTTQKYYRCRKEIANELQNNFNFIDYKEVSSEHHLYHAYASKYMCDINDACVIVLDGNGANKRGVYGISSSKHNYYVEQGSSYYLKDNNHSTIIKRYTLLDTSNINSWMSFTGWQGRLNNQYIKDEYNTSSSKYVISDEPGPGARFSMLSEKMGLDREDGGKVMGLAQYYNTGISTNCSMNKWVELANFAQTNFEKALFNFIDESLEKCPSTNNIVLTGGCALNCVANSKVIQRYSKYNIIIDPVCFDAGISIGAAYYETVQRTLLESNNKNKAIYIGSSIDYIPLFPELRDTSVQEIAQLLADGNVVALAQGNSEAGQRALGNRSILFNPSIANGKDIVNKVKKRENYRPFAASILEDKAEEWFDMLGLKNSPYMQFVFKSYYPEKIPAAVHVDGTSRIQTVDIEQNKNYYNLINEFYKITGIPMVLNTSFNLAGEPLVEDIIDVYKTFKESEIQYVYFPEFSKVLDKSKYSYGS